MLLFVLVFVSLACANDAQVSGGYFPGNRNGSLTPFTPSPMWPPIHYPTPPPFGLTRNCQSGWKRLGDNCYHLNWIQRNFSEAQVYCRKFFAHLPSIHSQEEHDNVTHLLFHEYKANSTWLGSTTIALGSPDYKWLDGTQFNFTKWGADEPNCEVNTRCAVEIRSEGDKTEWRDIKESNMRTVLCQESLRPHNYGRLYGTPYYY